MKQSDELVLRPHHGLCIRHFTGKGYSKPFTRNMRRQIDRLNAAPAQIIRLKTEPDVVCACCPHNLEDVCESAQKVAEYDEKCLSLCGLHDRQQIAWEIFQQAIEQYVMDAGKLREVCSGCCWLKLCEAYDAAFYSDSMQILKQML